MAGHGDGLLGGVLASCRDGLRAVERLPRDPRDLRRGPACRTLRGRSSTASTRPGRSCTPRTPTGSRAPGRRSSACPTRRSSASTSTTSRCYIPTARLRRYARVLDMREGTLTRELDWSTAAGKHVTVRSCRLVSLEHRHVAAIHYEVVVHDRAAPVVISSEIVNRQDAPFGAGEPGRPAVADPRRAARLLGRVLEPVVCEAGGHRLAAGLPHGEQPDDPRSRRRPRRRVRRAARDPLHRRGDEGAVVVTVDAQPGVPIRSRSDQLPDLAGGAAERARRSAAAARSIASGAVDSMRCVAAQRAQLDRFWDRADVRVDVGELDVADAAGGPLEPLPGRAGHLARRGLGRPGEGPDRGGLRRPLLLGHRDLRPPVPLLHAPADRAQPAAVPPPHAPARPRARARARPAGRDVPVADHQRRGGVGVLPGGHRPVPHQRGHRLRASAATSQARGDVGFLAEVGAEILVETARLWADLGFYADDGEFHIHGVTGPDEYTTVVNDNAYTNLMARLNLRYAAEAVRAPRRRATRRRTPPW